MTASAPSLQSPSTTSSADLAQTEQKSKMQPHQQVADGCGAGPPLDDKPVSQLGEGRALCSPEPHRWTAWAGPPDPLEHDRTADLCLLYGDTPHISQHSCSRPACKCMCMTRLHPRPEDALAQFRIAQHSSLHACPWCLQSIFVCTACQSPHIRITP